MKFVDEAEIAVEAGHGGPGAKHFRREKFVPQGGPDGGDGGEGGSVIAQADPNKHTLLDFRYRKHWKAESGAPGGTSNKEGKSGDDLVIHLPVGTEIVRASDGELVADLAHPGDRFVIARGGRGGKGNAFFKSATNRVPEHTQPGEPGEKGEFLLSLKLVADVGIIGFPNAGKSTLISRISAARPKIADYPFTTLVPNLGVVDARGKRRFVVADVPGLIPGAHAGKGLGLRFLKHIERTRVILHLTDINGSSFGEESYSPLDAVRVIMEELAAFSPEVAAKPQLIGITKIDSASGREAIDDARREIESAGFECLAISSATGEGIEELVEILARKVHS